MMGYAPPRPPVWDDVEQWLMRLREDDLSPRFYMYGSGLRSFHGRGGSAYLADQGQAWLPPSLVKCAYCGRLGRPGQSCEGCGAPVGRG